MIDGTETSLAWMSTSRWWNGPDTVSLLQGLVIRRAGDRDPAREQQTFGHQGVDMRMPVRLTAEGLNRRHDPRRAVLSIERRPPAARDGLRCAARQDAEQTTLPQEQPSQGLRDGEDRVSVRDRRDQREDILMGPSRGPVFGSGR